MRVLVAGAGGMLGRDVVDACASRGHEVIARARGELDVTDARAVDAYRKALAHGFANPVWLAEVHHKLGLALEGIGRLDEATADLETGDTLAGDYEVLGVERGASPEEIKKAEDGSVVEAATGNPVTVGRRVAAKLHQHLARFHSDHVGGGTSRSRQILRARNSSISRCRGTVELLRLARFTYTLWLAPSRSSWHPCDSMCRMRSRRFMPPMGNRWALAGPHGPQAIRG